MTKQGEYTCADIRQLTPPVSVTKIGRILHQLGSGEVLNNRSAFVLGDTCLHSTVSALRNDHGIVISGEPEKYSGYDGHASQRHRYWVEPDPIVLRSAYRLLRLWGWSEPKTGGPSPTPKLNLAA